MEKGVEANYSFKCIYNSEILNSKNKNKRAHFSYLNKLAKIINL